MDLVVFFYCFDDVGGDYYVVDLFDFWLGDWLVVGD